MPSWARSQPPCRQSNTPSLPAHNAPIMPLAIEEGASLLENARRAIATRVVGQDDAITDLLVAFVARGHVLIEGVPGTAKTLLARTMAHTLDVKFGRIQFT